LTLALEESMSRRRQRLTPVLAAQIAAGVRSGSFPHVAAQAFGVTAARFQDWLKRGADEHAREPFRSFAATIEQAAAQARLRAEMAVLNEAPKAWLQLGPGRERDDAPGWTSAARPRAREQADDETLTFECVTHALNAVTTDDAFTLDIKEKLARAFAALESRKAA
jgi:hypothetical protein